MLEDVLHALHQDNAVERGVLTHHAAGAIPAHHKLQIERDVSRPLGVSVSNLPFGSRPGPLATGGNPFLRPLSAKKNTVCSCQGPRLWASH